MKKQLLLIAVLFACVSCELDEVVTADSENVVIAEIYLLAGEPVQRALLHRTTQPSGSSVEVPNARIEVTDSAGNVMRYFPAPDTMCVPPTSLPLVGSCYVTETQSSRVAPGEPYTLRITLAEGGEITGNTIVPEDFHILRPDVHTCTLAPFTRFEISWSRSPDAWVYASEVTIDGIRDYLTSQGLPSPPQFIELFGLSVSSADTTISFPNEFGLFDRFNSDLTEVLVAIQGGLPEGATAMVEIAAADRNYVNWERGGNFNPSGVVRIGNLRGAGAGVFGSLVTQHLHVNVTTRPGPAC